MERDQAIADYLAGLGVLDELAGADPGALNQCPVDGGWPAAWVLHHLADSELVNAVRLRRILSEHEPALGSYDELAWADALHYDARDPRHSAALVRLVRESNVSILHALDESGWSRFGVHHESGVLTVDTWMRSLTQHLAGHVDQALVALG